VGDEQHLKSSWGGVNIDKVKENKHKNRKEAVWIKQLLTKPGNRAGFHWGNCKIKSNSLKLRKSLRT
jgi:hypothetical protein